MQTAVPPFSESWWAGKNFQSAAQEKKDDKKTTHSLAYLDSRGSGGIPCTSPRVITLVVLLNISRGICDK